MLYVWLIGQIQRFLPRAYFEWMQRRRLRALLRHAKAHVPYYRRLLRDIDADTAPLESIPVTTKRELTAALPDSLAEGTATREEVETFANDKNTVGQYFKQRYIICCTSGTSGDVGLFIHDIRAWNAMRRVQFQRMLSRVLTLAQALRLTLAVRVRCAMVIGTGGHYVTQLMSQLMSRFVQRFFEVKQYSIMLNTPSIVAGLNAFRPHMLHGYPTSLHVLAEEQQQGRLSIDPILISASSEPFSDLARAAVAAAWPHAQVCETYGATEFAAIASPCRHGRLHVNTDVCVVESVDDAGRAVPDGTPGRRILLTNLLNRVQPIIRYDLADSVTYLAEPCGCGSVLPAIQVNGRADDTFYLRDADGVYHAHAPIPLTLLFTLTQGVRQFQLVHESQNQLHVRFACAAGFVPNEVETRLRTRMQSYFRDHGLGDTVTLTFEPVNEVTRDAVSQKIRQIYSKVARPAT